VDIHTRKLRYFVVLAEELHFSRAAQRLFIAQQALSKQIHDMEREIGASLLTRSTRQVSLTAAGEAFLAAARTILATLDGAVDEAQGLSRRETGVLRVGFGVGAALELTAPILEEFSRRYPGIDLELREFPLSEPAAGLVEGASDVALVRPPLTGEDLEFVQLFVEPRVAAVGAHHRLADKESVSVAEVIDEPIVLGRSTDPAWRRFWLLDDYRAGKPASRIRNSTSHTEELELVAAGLAVTVTVAGAARYTPHAGLRFVSIRDIPGSVGAVAWCRKRQSSLVERFVAVAEDVRDREAAIVAMIEQGAGPDDAGPDHAFGEAQPGDLDRQKSIAGQ
jgi:DNA-binding transcriptional LysR family regulator